MSNETLTQDEQDFEAAFTAANKSKPNTTQVEAPQGEDDRHQEVDVLDQEGDGEKGDAKAKGEPKANVEQKLSKGAAAEETVESLKQKLAIAQRERDDALQKWRSDLPRQSTLVKENARLKGEVETLTAQVKRLEADAKSAKASNTSASGEGSSDLLENAPELKAAVESRIQAAIETATRGLREELDAAKEKAALAAQVIEPLASREEQRQFEEVRQQLDKLFPNWRDDAEDIAAWVNTQPEQIKSMFPGTGFADSSTVLKLFYADKGAQPAAGNRSGSGAGSNVDRVRRAAGIAPRAVTRVQPDPNDFDAAFAEFSANKKR